MDVIKMFIELILSLSCRLMTIHATIHETINCPWSNGNWTTWRNDGHCGRTGTPVNGCLLPNRLVYSSLKPYDKNRCLLSGTEFSEFVKKLSSTQAIDKWYDNWENFGKIWLSILPERIWIEHFNLNLILLNFFYLNFLSLREVLLRIADQI